MKRSGHILIAAGFLAGAWVSVQHESEMNWLWFLPALALGILGVGLARGAQRGQAQSGETVSRGLRALEESLQRVVEKITTLEARKLEMHPYDVHGAIDERFPADLTVFVEARESISHAHGLQAYAEVMNEFAAGERYLNRVWSASVDGYVDEVHEYLSRSKEQFILAQGKLAQYQSGTN